MIGLLLLDIRLFFSAIFSKNDPDFSFQFLGTDISGKNPNNNITIFYRADARQSEPACFSKVSQIVFATVTGSCA